MALQTIILTLFYIKELRVLIKQVLTSTFIIDNIKPKKYALYFFDFHLFII